MKVATDDQFGAIVSRLDVEQGLPSQSVFAVLSERNADGSESVIAGTNRGLVRTNRGTSPRLCCRRASISQRIHDQSELRSGLKLDYPQNVCCWMSPRSVAELSRSSFNMHLRCLTVQEK